MIELALADEVWLADVAAARGEPDALHIWWMGQSGFLVQWAGRHLLLDPYLSDSLTRKYAGTDKPHVRMTRRVVAPERLGFVDVISSSHNHTDHLDAETVGPILAANSGVQIVAPEANRAFVAERLGVAPDVLIGMDVGKSATIAGFTFHGVPAAHEQLEIDEQGRYKFLGYVIEVGPWTLYHSGDTVLYAGMAERLKTWRVDVAMLPINGRAAERRVAGNLNGVEAAQLAWEIGAGVAIPCHYEMFEFNTASPDAFVAECARLGQAAKVLRAGERATFEGEEKRRLRSL